MNRVFSSVLMLAIGLGACLSAVPASAALADAGPSAADNITAQGKIRAAGGTIMVREGLTLGPGTKTKDDGTLKFELSDDDQGAPLGMRMEWDDAAFSIPAVEATYPLFQFGKPTGCSIRMSMRLKLPYIVVADCNVVADGPTKTLVPTCETVRHGLDHDWDFRVNMEGGVAEASGTIQTEGWVSLGQGWFPDYGMSFAMKGAQTVDALHSTRFTTVLRTSDAAPKFPGQARTEFVYRILDENGASTDYTVLGANTSNGDQLCTVTPLGGPYECSVVGSRISGMHWDSTFTITRKAP